MKKVFYEKIIALIVAFSLVITPVSTLAAETKGIDADVKNPAMNSANWMGFLPNGVKLNAINIPATHDSGTSEIMDANISKTLVEAFIGLIKNTMHSKEIWVGAASAAISIIGSALMLAVSPFILMAGLVGKRSLAPFAQDQELSIPDQLRQGVRVLDCRLSNYTNNEKAPWRDCLVFSHGGFKCTRNGRDLTMAQAIEDARAFLKENPTETVILGVRHEGFAFTPQSAKPFLKETFEALTKVIQDALGCNDLTTIGNTADEPLENMKKELSDRSRFSDVIVGDPAELTMGEARGKIIITDKDNIAANYVNDYEAAGKKKWEDLEAYFKSAEDPNSKDYAPLDYSVSNVEKKIAESSCTNKSGIFFGNGLLSFISILKTFGKDVIIKWRSGADAQAIDVNPKLRSYHFQKGIRYGWLYMDFVREDLAKQIYETNVFDFNVAGHPIDYIADIHISYDQSLKSAQAHFDNTAYQTFKDNFNEDGSDKVLSGAIVNGVKNNGSFNIAVGFLTSKYPKDALTGLTWTQKEWEKSALPDDVKQLLNDYHFVLVDPLAGKNAVELLDEDKDKITTSDGFASFNIGTKGYVTNLYLTRDSAFGERMIALDAIPALNKVLPEGMDPDMQEEMRQSIEQDIEKRFKTGKEMPRDTDGNVFASNFARGAINDVFLVYDTAFNEQGLKNYWLRNVTIHKFDEHLGKFKLRTEP